MLSDLQAIGATTPAFTAALSLIILNSRETARTYAALLPVVIGIVIATGAEPSFNLAGFAASVMATAARAFKSVLQVCFNNAYLPFVLLKLQHTSIWRHVLGIKQQRCGPFGVL